MCTSHENSTPTTRSAIHRTLAVLVALLTCAALVGGGLVGPAAFASDEKGLPRIKVKKPNGGEIWVRDEKEVIKWRSKNGFTGFAVRIELLKDGTFERTITPSTPNDGKFKWVVPNDVELNDNYKVRIISIDYPAIRDRSNNPFTIVVLI